MNLAQLRHNTGRRLRQCISVIWPRECALCERPLEATEDVLCLQCLMELPRYGDTRQIVNTSVPGGSIAVRSWFFYDSYAPFARLIRDIKYHDRPGLARKLGREFAVELEGDAFFSDHPIDVILPVPLHWTKHVARSYNQAAEIARGVSDVSGIKVGDNLRATRAHRTQTARSSTERDENVRDIFRIVRPAELDGRHIALLDDVITTGATMFSALHEILAVCRPASITFLSLGNTRPD